MDGKIYRINEEVEVEEGNCGGGGKSRLRGENKKNCDGGGKKMRRRWGKINILEREGIQE